MLKLVKKLYCKYKSAIYFLIFVSLINYCFIFIALTVTTYRRVDFEGYQKYIHEKYLDLQEHGIENEIIGVKNYTNILKRILKKQIINPTNDYKTLNDSKANDILNKNMQYIKKRLSKKIILKWSQEYSDEDHWLHNELNNIFSLNHCQYNNCEIIYKKDLLPDTRRYNAIIFTRFDVCNPNPVLPKHRELFQKYVFASLSPAPFFPVTNPSFDDFFNWTWTYRLDSDILWRQITIHDLENRVVGPSIDMKWKKNMAPIPEVIKTRLRQKSKAAMITPFQRKDNKSYYIDAVRQELNNLNYSLDMIDWNHNSVAYEARDDDYYFAFVLEIVDDEDYVSDRILWALKYYTVPIVYGAANYSRFLPPGGYIDANTYTPAALARTMADIVQNATAFDDFHRWRNYYSYAPSVETEVCNLCAALNDNEEYRKTTRHIDFRAWWNGKPE